MIRRVHPGWWFVDVPFLVLTALSTVVLYVIATETPDQFAWTVQPPVAAAFLGAGYASGFVLILLTCVERVWASARLALVTVFVFAVVTLLTTLVHTDRLHLDDGGTAGVAAWFWLAVYIVVPLGMSAMFAVQRREPGVDPPRRRPLPGVLVGLLGVEGVLLGVAGVALLIRPTWVEPAWPWTFTPLTGRAMGAWCLALGVAAALAVAERDAARLRAPAITYVALAVLHTVALARFGDDIRWGGPLTWAYLAVLALMAVTGAWGTALAQGAGRRQDAAAPRTASRPGAPARPRPSRVASGRS